MKTVQKGWVIAVLWVCLMAPSGALFAQSPIPQYTFPLVT